MIVQLNSVVTLEAIYWSEKTYFPEQNQQSLIDKKSSIRRSSHSRTDRFSIRKIENEASYLCSLCTHTIVVHLSCHLKQNSVVLSLFLQWAFPLSLFFPSHSPLFPRNITQREMRLGLENRTLVGNEPAYCANKKQRRLTGLYSNRISSEGRSHTTRSLFQILTICSRMKSCFKYNCFSILKHVKQYYHL